MQRFRHKLGERTSNCPTEATPISQNLGTDCDPDTRLENIAAELTGAVYPLVLRRGLRDSWLQAELSRNC